MCKFVKSRFCPHQGDLEAVISVKFIIRASDKERLRPFRAATETSYGYLFSRNRILADFSFHAGGANAFTVAQADVCHVSLHMV